MLLGKRPRPPMRRTTSMTELAADSGEVEAPDPSDHLRPRERRRASDGPTRPVGLPTEPPRNLQRRHSVDIMAVETAHFLRACGLCKRRLGPGLDTFMYRGEVAFCSLECREQQIAQDERMENCLRTSMKIDAPMSTAGSQVPSTGETVAAA